MLVLGTLQADSTLSPETPDWSFITPFPQGCFSAIPAQQGHIRQDRVRGGGMEGEKKGYTSFMICKLANRGHVLHYLQITYG